MEASTQGLVIACGTGAVRFHALQLEGKRRMTVSEFIAGHALVTGTVLG
jgi:methionyl-tRNA formyltransferase